MELTNAEKMLLVAGTLDTSSYGSGEHASLMGVHPNLERPVARIAEAPKELQDGPVEAEAEAAVMPEPEPVKEPQEPKPAAKRTAAKRNSASRAQRT